MTDIYQILINRGVTKSKCHALIFSDKGKYGFSIQDNDTDDIYFKSKPDFETINDAEIMVTPYVSCVLT